jgi:chorismate synthase
VNIFGESHNASVGVLVDGIPAGIILDISDFTHDLLARKPHKVSQTARIEQDEPIIESGLFNGYTTGTPMLIRFLNSNTQSKDYSNLVTQPRPGHADFVMNKKYNGYNDYRGGGSFSGRLTLGIVSAGVIAKKIISNVEVSSKITNLKGCTNENEFESILLDAVSKHDSVGGVIEITAKNVPVGLGEPYFDSLESTISHLLFSIGGVKGVEFGIGFEGKNLYGSQFNDCIIDKDGTTKTNNSGGINGGISNGNDVVVRAFVKPTSSIGISQQTYNFKTDKVEELLIEGRHDAAIILRAGVVLEACVAIALADAYLINKAYR